MALVGETNWFIAGRSLSRGCWSVSSARPRGRRALWVAKVTWSPVEDRFALIADDGDGRVRWMVVVMLGPRGRLGARIGITRAGLRV